MFFSRQGNRLADMICGRSPELIVDLEGVCVPLPQSKGIQDKPNQNNQPNVQAQQITTHSTTSVYRMKSDFQNG
ncbi:MAG: hypothetical protein E7014_05770 [Alphaproteobacteria bacterium]|nr:hypothetical protein [Alphaproteobacteria bacterium]